MRNGAGIPDPTNSGSQLQSDVLPWFPPPQGPERSRVPYFFSMTVFLGHRAAVALLT